MKTLKIRDIEIGKGLPKICVPLVGNCREELLDEVRALSSVPHDIVEWRADYFSETFDANGVLAMLDELRGFIPKNPLLFTFRSIRDGGVKDITEQEYGALYETVIESGNADIVDIELFAGEDTVKKLVYMAGNNDLPLLISNHDFSATPLKQTIIARLLKMQELGADIAKIAVMPRTLKDVVSLLDASAEMAECYAEKPFVAISMSGVGFVSRVIGETFGSCITYASLTTPSAPGQLNAHDIDALLKLMHKSI